MKRRAPAAAAAASRWSVPWVRSRLVTVNIRSKWRRSKPAASDVIWWTTASGSARATASPTAMASRPSSTTGSAPSSRSRAALAGLRVDAVTWSPCATSWGSSCCPMAPAAPATKTRMMPPLSVVPGPLRAARTLRRGTASARDIRPASARAAATSRRRGGLAAYPVVQDEERQPEDGEGVLGPQLAVAGVDVKLLGEAVHRQHREIPGGGVDVGQVVPGLIVIAPAGQDQAAAGAGPRQQGRGEARLRQREADAHVPAATVPVGGVDADVDRLVGIGERADPAADHHVIGAVPGDGVDPAADT